MLNQETIKPRNLGETLGRLGRYFNRFWYMILLAVGFVIVATWTQVTTPELMGQATDCFLVPAGASGGGFASFFPDTGSTSQASSSSCYLAADDPSSLSFTRRLVYNAYTLGGFDVPNPAAMTDDQRIEGMFRLILVMIGLYVLGAVLTGLTFFTMAWTGQHVLRVLRVEVFEQLHRLSLSYYSEHEAGDLMSRITNDTTAIEQAFSFALVNVFSGILSLVWVSYKMLTANVPFALLSLSVAPIMFIATWYFSEQARKAFRISRQEIGNVNAELQESIAAVREVQAFNRADENIEQFKEVNAANRDANVRAVAYTSALAPTLEALSYVALAIVTGVGGWYLLKGQSLLGTTVTLGLVVTFLAYVQRFNQPIQQIAVLWTNIQNAIAGAERIFNILDEKPAVTDKPNATTMPPIKGLVEFENASHSYEDGVPVLRDVSFTAQPGQTIAIVGPTGAGKTTIINLIPRFYDVTSGSVKIDGMDVRDVTMKSLREQIGIVLQDTFLFSQSVMENVRFGRPDAADEEVMAAIKLANADSFIERLPEKYQTVLGERGSGLSQGQRQLLAIARAALSDPKILILDEATSSVDTRTERLIQKAFDELLKGRTAFVIAHRLSTIRNADLILVLKDGQIIERGKHDELLARQGFYYDLYMSQFKKQEEMEVVSK
ncbi:MAG: ABC transporter ATP-binding protein [Chloroflexi bacterium]|nr:ABC transporter ATP-binding protein [Chloroflexota bacterium]MDL1942144.1 ABC transporter ATP-binding protein [Chloroflexi bacterium CFX2]